MCRARLTVCRVDRGTACLDPAASSVPGRRCRGRAALRDRHRRPCGTGCAGRVVCRSVIGQWDRAGPALQGCRRRARCVTASPVSGTVVGPALLGLPLPDRCCGGASVGRVRHGATRLQRRVGPAPPGLSCGITCVGRVRNSGAGPRHRPALLGLPLPDRCCGVLPQGCVRCSATRLQRRGGPAPPGLSCGIACVGRVRNSGTGPRRRRWTGPAGSTLPGRLRRVWWAAVPVARRRAAWSRSPGPAVAAGESGVAVVRGAGTPNTGSRRDGPRRSSDGGSRVSGSRYSVPRRSPQCRQPRQWEAPGSTDATTCPAVTAAPSSTSGRTGS
ncbi:hypothetical protein SPRI_2246 [Streptomyces pristinaespiralis]|uniref:Uncharacterized protein n=1 Tax=Streptomyces pristinaespiralis TaxID=38300 RepID=A0A0M4D862_STRPR|nr:hypothetical protein SPRI_2246 [Streptomyces pristinaespiralis]